MGTKSSKLAPQELDDLRTCTEFSDAEIQKWYVGFKTDCPSGKLDFEQFTEIYAKFFPNGDATKFSAHTFRNFDQNQDGRIDFREFLCALSITKHGSAEDKLQWAFRMYDMDNNGYITKDEMLEIVTAIYKAFGGSLTAPSDEATPTQRVHKLFAEMDKNHDDRISMQEFIEGAKMDNSILKMLDDRQCDSPAHVIIGGV